MRTLFVIRDLPRATVSVAGMIRGEEALSGTHGSGLLVAEGLAKRGHEIGVFVLQGQRVLDSACLGFDSLGEAADWAREGRTIWISYGDESILDRLKSHGLHPLVWTHLPITLTERRWLEAGQIGGLVTVSDTCRVPLLRSRQHQRVGRIYNPLAPLFADQVAALPERFSRRTVVYAGATGPTKGLHRLLEMWKFVHRQDAKTKLVIAGSGKLYGSGRSLGRFGIAQADFEARYVEPLVAEFGSLDAAGIELAGLLNPMELQRLYADSSLGVVNPNWHEYTETFCCTAVEMIATGLPVFSVARSALPETIGRSGGAFLTRFESLERSAGEMSQLLSDSQRLANLGAAGRDFVIAEYGWHSIVDHWDKLLSHDSDIEELCGKWNAPKSARYYFMLLAGRAGVSGLVDGVAAGLRMLKRE